MRRYRRAGRPVQPRWEERETTHATAFAWIHWLLTKNAGGR